ncbi:MULTISPECIES: hypothetical protein [unclassified Streptomyces]|uniref:hypothetical protein n=1 Tax=unclassified Streptomyces TaxID=2593676 RepID=UPI00278BE062|nr:MULTISPECIES: hypothetical protein [unclassified Streptomyces]
MKLSKAASVAVGSALCGSLLLGTAGPALASGAEPDTSLPTAATTRMYADVNALYDAVNRYTAQPYGDPAEVLAALDRVLADPAPGQPVDGKDQVAKLKAELKTEIDALVSAASKGDLSATVSKLQAVPQLAVELLVTVSLGKLADEMKLPDAPKTPKVPKASKDAAAMPKLPELPKAPSNG